MTGRNLVDGTNTPFGPKKPAAALTLRICLYEAGDTRRSRPSPEKTAAGVSRPGSKQTWARSLHAHTCIITHLGSRS